MKFRLRTLFILITLVAIACYILTIYEFTTEPAFRQFGYWKLPAKPRSDKPIISISWTRGIYLYRWIPTEKDSQKPWQEFQFIETAIPNGESTILYSTAIHESQL